MRLLEATPPGSTKEEDIFWLRRRFAAQYRAARCIEFAFTRLLQVYGPFFVCPSDVGKITPNATKLLEPRLERVRRAERVGPWEAELAIRRELGDPRTICAIKLTK